MAKPITHVHLPRRGPMLVMSVLLVLTLVFVAVTFFNLIRNSRYEQEWIANANVVQVTSQQLSKSAGEAAAGNLGAFGELRASNERINESMTFLRAGAPMRDLPPVPESLGSQLTMLGDTWRRMDVNTKAILEREDLVLELSAASSLLAEGIPQIQELTDRAVRQLTQAGAPTQQVFVASRQLVLADRILRRASEILQGGSGAISGAENLEKDLSLLEQAYTALLRGSSNMGVTPVRTAPAVASLTQARQQLSEIRPGIEALVSSSTDLFEVRGAADEIFLDSSEVFEESRALAEAVAALPETRVWPSMWSGIAGLLLIFTLVGLLLHAFLRVERRQAKLVREQNERNQEAILRLLDELGSLADGDLTVHASVHDDFTGAIADAVNYAVEQLRELVTGINRTARTVASSSQETHQLTNRLASESTHQAEEVRDAAEAINNMATAFDKMARHSSESSDVAQRSEEIAHHGADRVRETIAGMDRIREQIQDTSKRIKRLGESSQEIGDIVELINGIAEQTNVLALNAAIQASSGGGAGKGFAVVADEVQQLAERATKATRRIETLVRTIQADTSEAVMSMESTTSEVVQGAQLAEEAGKALERIESVSKDLSSLIQATSGEAQSQSSTATQVAQLMNRIRDVCIETAEGAGRTAGSVGQLAEQVMQLERSVADFKLPDEDVFGRPAETGDDVDETETVADDEAEVEALLGDMSEVENPFDDLPFEDDDAADDESERGQEARSA